MNDFLEMFSFMYHIVADCFNKNYKQEIEELNRKLIPIATNLQILELERKSTIDKK